LPSTYPSIHLGQRQRRYLTSSLSLESTRLRSGRLLTRTFSERRFATTIPSLYKDRQPPERRYFPLPTHLPLRARLLHPDIHNRQISTYTSMHLRSVPQDRLDNVTIEDIEVLKLLLAQSGDVNPAAFTREFDEDQRKVIIERSKTHVSSLPTTINSFLERSTI